MNNQNNPDEEDKNHKTGEHGKGDRNSTESAHLELKGCFAEWVYINWIKTRAAFIWTVRGRRANLRVESIDRLVLTWFADCVGIVILEGACFTRLAERSAVSTEALSSIHNTILSVLSLEITKVRSDPAMLSTLQ